MASSSDQSSNLPMKLESPDPTLAPPAAVAHGSVFIGISDDYFFLIVYCAAMASSLGQTTIFPMQSPEPTPPPPDGLPPDTPSIFSDPGGKFEPKVAFQGSHTDYLAWKASHFPPGYRNDRRFKVPPRYESPSSSNKRKRDDESSPSPQPQPKRPRRTLGPPPKSTHPMTLRTRKQTQPMKSRQRNRLPRPGTPQ